jgi:uncharacterized protein (TIGR03437 family)
MGRGFVPISRSRAVLNRILSPDGQPIILTGTKYLSAPSSKPDNNRVQPTETTIFALTATLTNYKLVLADLAGNTMIAEIPLPGCVGLGSPFAPAITTARAAFNAQLTAATSFKTANVPVLVKGVGFFDFLHGQTGVAPNGIELHPILDIVFNPTPTITSVNTAGGFQGIAQNDWIEIKGTKLAPSSVGSSGMTWSNAPEFAAGKMPTQLSNVSVKVNGKSAYVYYISDTQINVLTPLDDTQGQVPIVVTNGNHRQRRLLPLRFDPRRPRSFWSAPASTPSQRTPTGRYWGPRRSRSLAIPSPPHNLEKTAVLYAVGFGLPGTTLVEGSSTQLGTLPSLPTIQIGGAPAPVQFAGVISPGLYQLNVIVPPTATTGDNAMTASYGGVSTPTGSLIAVQR